MKKIFGNGRADTNVYPTDGNVGIGNTNLQYSLWQKNCRA